MRISKTTVAMAMCLAVASGAAVVYAQSADNKYDGTATQSQPQNQTTSPQTDQSGSAGGMTKPSQMKRDTGVDATSSGSDPTGGLNGRTSTPSSDSGAASTMDHSPSGTPTGAVERPARADRN